jgi:hypothetical protein
VRQRAEDPFAPYLDYVTARLVEDPHLWGITLCDELEALDPPLPTSSPTPTAWPTPLRSTPKPEDFDAPLPPLMAVKLAAFRRAAAEKELAGAIHAAREAQLSWRELGEAIGTSGEAARQRYAS